MSRQSAATDPAPAVASFDLPDERSAGLESLHEGIALLARLERTLADMEDSLDRLALAKP